MLLNISSDMGEKQGLNPDSWYEAFVVANDDRKHPDGMMLGRIQARISLIFDGITSSDLPWAIPVWDHPDGATSISGMFNVPKVGSKVLLRFQQGNPSFPMYRGFHVDLLTQMEETKYNYPNRKVIRCMNKALIVVDTKDNVAYIRNPGKLKIFIDGNVELQVNGSVDELIHGDVRRIIKGNVDETIHGSVYREIKGNVEEMIRGRVYRAIKGSLDEEVTQNRKYHTGGSLLDGVAGSARHYSGGSSLYEASGTLSVEGSSIYENSGNAQGDPGATTVPQVPAKPVFHKWPGIPGSAKGTNTRNKATASASGSASPEYAKDTQPPTVNANIAIDPEV